MLASAHSLLPLALIFGKGTVRGWVEGYGYWLVGALVAAESLGVPLPGETALIAAAAYASSTGRLSVAWVVAVAAAAAIMGDNAGYAIGRYGGAPLLLRYGPKIHLDERKLKVGVWVFRTHGGKVVFLGRFVSLLRTYAAFLAGANRMPWLRFLLFNASGGVVWATLFGVLGAELGNALERASSTLHIVLGVVGGIVLVAGLVWLKRRERTLEERADREIGPLREELA